MIQTAKFPPSICTAGLPDDPAAPNPSCLVNKIALDSVGGVGAQIEFVLQPLSPGSYMTNMKLVPGTGGVYMEHPLFVSWPAGSVEGRDDCAPEFSKSVFEPGPLGVLPRLVKTRFGFHVVFIERRIEGRLMPFDAVRPQIEGFLAERVSLKAAQQYVMLLAGAAEIEGVAFESATSALVQ